MTDTPSPNPAEIWQEALTKMSYQMEAPTFDSLLRGSHLLKADGDAWTIAVTNPRAPAALSQIQAPVVNRALTYVTRGRPITLNYVHNPSPPPKATGPRIPDPTNSPSPKPALPALHAVRESEGSESEASVRKGSPTTQSPTCPACPACPEGIRREGIRRERTRRVPNILQTFNPNSPAGGGYWQMGHHATWFWAPLLGAVAWRVYELVVSGDKRKHKTLWSPPRRYSISELARAVASGRNGRPNRDQIRGRYRKIAGQRTWRPGAFDLLVRHNVARVEWHNGALRRGDLLWHLWQPGGGEGSGLHPGGGRRHVLRLVYRISVVTCLPLLTPLQVGALVAERQVAHERYLANRGLDLQAWEQITLPTLAGLEELDA